MFNNIKKEFNDLNLITHYGKITKIVGTTIECVGPVSKLGELCYVNTSDGDVACEVIGFNDNKTILMPFSEILGAKLGDRVYSTGSNIEVKVGLDLKGKIINGLGEPIDELVHLKAEERRSIYSKPSSPLKRKRISERLETGIKAIDSMLPLAKGQRTGIFAGSGVGKSSLMGMLAKYAKADINVICLVGERGKEVMEFIEDDLQEGIEKSVVVVATSDEPALMKIKACLTSLTIAEYFRDKGLNVMLMMDNLTRYANAQREVGIATGEKVAQRGYTPSVFSSIPKLLERAGTSESSGSITGIFAVLVDGDDLQEPISDTVRGVLDGHIVLDRTLANMGHFPAINILSSVSRVSQNICTNEELELMSEYRSILANYKEVEDILSIGAYSPGNPKIDRAVALKDISDAFLKQGRHEFSSTEETFKDLKSLLSLKK